VTFGLATNSTVWDTKPRTDDLGAGRIDKEMKVNQEPEPRVLHEPLFAMRNHHYETSGKPPFITDEGNPGKRFAYFENELGEQLLFTYDAGQQQGTLYHGDCGWDTPYNIVDGAVPDLVLAPVEKLWLVTCWCAATGADIPQTIKQADAQYAQANRDAALHVARLQRQAAETGKDILELLEDEDAEDAAGEK
jgi:hypothetical protein